MLPLNILTLSIFLSIPTTLAVQYSPFLTPNPNHASDFNGLINLSLFRRDSKCANDCSSMNAAACCPKNTNCALDGAGNVACCPENAACTGSLGEAGGAAATVKPGASSPTAAASAGITHAINGGSTVANGFYPYPYLPTTYANAGQCTSSFSSCQLESAKCTGILEGGGMAVTVSGPGGGVTQAGAMPVPSAESICSSLSVEACRGLALTQCSSLGGATQTAAGNFVAGGSANAAPTKNAAMYGMGMGVMFGLAGQVVR